MSALLVIAHFNRFVPFNRAAIPHQVVAQYEYLNLYFVKRRIEKLQLRRQERLLKL